MAHTHKSHLLLPQLSHSLLHQLLHQLLHPSHLASLSAGHSIDCSKEKTLLCHFCGKLGHFIQQCSEAQEYIWLGRCKHSSEGKIVLPCGSLCLVTFQETFWRLGLMSGIIGTQDDFRRMVMQSESPQTRSLHLRLFTQYPDHILKPQQQQEDQTWAIMSITTSHPSSATYFSFKITRPTLAIMHSCCRTLLIGAQLTISPPVIALNFWLFFAWFSPYFRFYFTHWQF